MEAGGDVDYTTPLFHSTSSSSSTTDISIQKPPFQTNDGTIWTALAHIITAVIGSGVLSLAWSMSQLGWIAGPVVFLVFAFVTILSCFLLSDCYKSPHPQFGPTTNGSYLDAVQTILGKRKAAICGFFVIVNFVKLGIVYTITSATSMRAILKSNCHHKQGVESTCDFDILVLILVFGVLQLFVSQISDFENTKWLSVTAAIMSFTYSIIGSGLGLARIIENGKVKGSMTGVPASSAAEKTWTIAQAVGNVAFSFPFSLVFLNIQVLKFLVFRSRTPLNEHQVTMVYFELLKNTLGSPPPEEVTMKKTSIFAVCIITTFYFSCGGFGYAGYGNSTPGNILTGFDYYEAYWLVDFANACVILHLIGAYQVYSQPLFIIVERWYADCFPESRIVHDELSFKLPLLPTVRLNILRLCFRTAYVASITGIAMLFPYFNQIVGVAGSINFWPITVYFPIEMYLVQKNIGCWTAKSVILRGYSVVFFFVMIFAFIGSVKELISARFH